MEHEIVKQARKAAGLTQRQLAALIGADQSFISQWERGRRGLSNEYLSAMPRAVRAPIVRARIAALEKLL